MFYKILKDNGSSNTFSISKDFMEKNNLDSFTRLSINAGLRKVKAKLKIIEDIKEDTLILSEDIIDSLLIPTDIKYQISFNNNSLNIGPVIGYLAAKTKFNLQKSVEFVKNQNTLTYCPYNGFCRSTTVAYPGIQGLLYVFSSDGIDIENNRIEGYYYNPNYSAAEKVWKKGFFPLPSTVYKRKGMVGDKNRKKLMVLTGNKVFNSHWGSKLGFWRMASKDPYVKDHIPFTKVFRNFDDLEDMLNNFKSVYLKLNLSMLAMGLIKVTKSKGKYLIQRPFDTVPLVFENQEDTFRYLSKRVKRRTYLIQQGIDTLTYKEGTTIFRVIMQKDDSLKWKCTGICPRVGNASGITTNYAPASYVFTFESFLKEILNMDVESIKKKKKELVDLCFKLSYMCDRSGQHYADIGIDIGMDKSL